MSGVDWLRRELASSMSGAPDAQSAADLLCTACVSVLGIDGAAISLVHHETTSGPFGCSGDRSRTLEDLQFTIGEGPGLDAARMGRIVLAPDLAAVSEVRWPVFAGAALSHGAAAVFALPISLSSVTVGALDLFRDLPGALGPDDLAGAGLAATLAALPLLELMSAERDGAPTAGVERAPDQLASLARVEVYQATGMLMGAWDVSAPEALVRLRARAFSLGTTAHQLASSIIERTIMVDNQGWVGDPAGRQG